MGFFQRIFSRLFGRRSELEELLREEVAPAPRAVPVPVAPAAPALAPVALKAAPAVKPAPAAHASSGIAVEVRPRDIQKVATLPPPPPGAPPVDLRNGVDGTHFSSSILIGLESALDDLASEASPADAVVIAYLRKTISGHAIRLPTMPEAIVKIEEVLRHPDAAVSAVADCISAEPAIATKLVGIANSPFYAGGRRITSIEGAIGRLGMNETKIVVQAMAFGSRLFRVPGWEKQAELLYRHALVAAMASRALADQVGLDSDELFMAGLVHDIGRMVVLSMVSDLERSKKTHVAIALVEQVSEQIHADLSALVAESWNASVEAVVATRYHHRPGIIGPTTPQRYGRVLQLADGIARSLLEPQVAEAGLAAALDAESVAALGVEPYLAEIVDRVRENAAAFEVPVVRESRRAV